MVRATMPRSLAFSCAPAVSPHSARAIVTTRRGERDIKISFGLKREFSHQLRVERTLISGAGSPEKLSLPVFAI